MRRSWWAASLCVLAGLSVAVWAWVSTTNATHLEVYGTVPDFALLERSGQTVTRADLLDKVSVVDFFYTRCPDTCPLQSAHLARLQAELPGASRLRLVSITVDPDHDRPEILARYATRFHADPTRWLFLTGPREAIYKLAVDGFHLAAVASRRARREPGWAWVRPSSAWAYREEIRVAHAGDSGPSIINLVHASRFALVDRQARIRGYFDGTEWEDVKRLQHEVAGLLGRR